MRKELNGMWWVKGGDEAKFSGRLRYAGGYKPILEIFLMEFDFHIARSVPDNCTIYGEVFDEAKFVQPVTLLGCTAYDESGIFTVQPFLYKQQLVRVECVAKGMLLNDEEIHQITSPPDVYLKCPGIDEYSGVHTIERVFKDDIPSGRPYRIDDIEKLVFTQPKPIKVRIDIATITVSLGQSIKARDISSSYLIHISLDQSVTQTEVNSLIYSQFLSFLSLMTGRRELIERHTVSVNSSRASTDSLPVELSYGYLAHTTQESEYSMRDSLLIGNTATLAKFTDLFPNWRKNFTFVERMANHFIQMVEQRTEASLLQAYPVIEEYVLARLLKQNKKGMPGILSKAINFIADHYSGSNLYGNNFPTERREHIADQLANFRHKRIHPKSTAECIYSPAQVYAYIVVILRSIFLKEMHFPIADIDSGISHWPQWHQLPKQP